MTKATPTPFFITTPTDTAIDSDADPSSESILFLLLDVELGATGLNLDTDLLDGGHLDSLAVLDLVLVIEDTFRIELTDEDIVPEHFRTIRDLADLVERRRS